MPPVEVEICKRLRSVREGVGLSQVEAARRLGVDSTFLASYEHARAPVKYGFADTFMRKFDVCPRWLATGRMPQLTYIPVPDSAKLDKAALFSSIYNLHLREPIDGTLASIAETMDCRESEIDIMASVRLGNLAEAGQPESSWQALLGRLLVLAEQRAMSRDGQEGVRRIAPMLRQFRDTAHALLSEDDRKSRKKKR